MGNPRPQLRRLPAYCPDPNAVESVWSSLKYEQLVDDFPAGVGELDDGVIERLIDLKFDPGLPELLRE